jgi:hypothetical protein
MYSKQYRLQKNNREDLDGEDYGKDYGENYGEDYRTKDQSKVNMLAKNKSNLMSNVTNTDLLRRLQRLGDSGSINGIRQLIKYYKVTTPPRDLNKIVKITGYKFITRQGQLFFIKDTQFYRQAELDNADNQEGNQEYNNSWNGE